MISYEQAIGIKNGYFEGDDLDFINAVEFLEGIFSDAHSYNFYSMREYQS